MRDAEGNEAEDSFIVTVGEEEESSVLMWVVVALVVACGVAGAVWYTRYR